MRRPSAVIVIPSSSGAPVIFPRRVAMLTDGQKAHVVHDGIGELTFFFCLRSRGLMASFSASSGGPHPSRLAR